MPFNSTSIAYNCTCQTPYFGDVCDLTVCSSSPCLNGMFTIYVERRVTFVILILNNILSQGGTCQLNGLTYSCSCLPGFSGLYKIFFHLFNTEHFQKCVCLY